MRKTAKLGILLGVLAIVVAAVVIISRIETKKEDIKNSGEVILEVPPDSVTALSWTNKEGTFSFTKDGSWTYDGDKAFPVDEEKINKLLSPLASFTAAFVINNVTDYEQYGLGTPECTVTVTAGEEKHTISLGDISKMDSQRYVSIGDGKAYLTQHDLMDEFDAVLRDMILDDTVPSIDTAEKITFSGTEEYTVTRDEEGKSICAKDIYFADGKPLDTANVDSFLSALKSLGLKNYASYNVSEEELKTFGMKEPEQTVEVAYKSKDGDGNTGSDGNYVLHLSRNPEEAAAYAAAVREKAEKLPEVSCYARVGDSQIVYKITGTEYDTLTAVSYNALRHQELFTADLHEVTSVDIRLNGETYSFVHQKAPEGDAASEEDSWTCLEKEFDAEDFKNALTGLVSDSFTDQAAEGQEEISLVFHLDNEDFPSFRLTLYRYDGMDCLAETDGAPAALVSRSQTVALIEAVNKVVLTK